MCSIPQEMTEILYEVAKQIWGYSGHFIKVSDSFDTNGQNYVYIWKYKTLKTNIQLLIFCLI